MPQGLFTAMRQSVVDGAVEHAIDVARQALQAGLDPLDAINQGFVPGMDYVGEQFARRTMFFPDLVMAGEAMKAGVAILEPELQRRGTVRDFAGTVILGTTKGDIHEIGKSLVGVLLTASGFKVCDLGVSVPAETFLEKARELDADIVGISALLTTTMTGQRTVVEVFQQKGLRSRVQIMVGGAPVTRSWAEKIGADGYAPDAVSAVRLAKTLMEKIAARPSSDAVCQSI